jgi:hypothetical protein
MYFSIDRITGLTRYCTRKEIVSTNVHLFGQQAFLTYGLMEYGSIYGFCLARPAESDPCSVAWVVPLLPAPAR